MTRSSSLLRASLLAAALHGPTATAQSPAAAAAPAGCTYATCGLRIEPSFLGPRLVRGASGESVSRLGAFGGGIVPLLNGPDSAAAYGRAYVRQTHRGTTMALIGSVTYTAVLLHTHNFRSDKRSNADLAVALAGVGLLLGSAPFGMQAARSLSQAVWWYNAALPR